MKIFAIFCFLFVSVWCSEVQVEFLSKAPSGNIMIQGTLSFPPSTVASPPYKAVVLVAGSGVGQRNESFTVTVPLFAVSPPLTALKLNSCDLAFAKGSTFVDLADGLNQKGYAVLRYNKRGCVSASKVPGCDYKLCPIDNPNPPLDCVNLHKLAFDDLITDAQNAVNYLKTLTDINKSSLNIIGHSQGCTVVPYITGVKKIVQLMGNGIPINDVFVAQLETNELNLRSGLAACSAQQNPLQSTLKYYEEAIAAVEQSLIEADKAFEGILDGSIGNETLVLGANGKFWRQWIAKGKWNEKYEAISKAISNGSKILSVNSPTDLQVWAQFYMPLHSVLMTQSPQNYQISILPNLTHFLTPADFSSGHVSQSVIQTTSDFLSSF